MLIILQEIAHNHVQTISINTNQPYKPLENVFLSVRPVIFQIKQQKVASFNVQVAILEKQLITHAKMIVH